MRRLPSHSIDAIPGVDTPITSSRPLPYAVRSSSRKHATLGLAICFFIASALSAQSTDPGIASGDSLRLAAVDIDGKLEAVEAYRSALADSTSVEALSGIGQAFHDVMLLRMGAGAGEDAISAAADSAEAYLRLALELNPSHGRSLATMAQVLFRMTDALNADPANYDEAAAFAERLLERDPALGHYLLGRIYWLKGEHVFALEAVERSLQADPDGYLPRLVLGYLHFDLGQHHKGIPAQGEAIERNPDDAIPLTLQGFSYIHIGLPERARPLFDDATALAMTEYTVGGHLMIHLSQRDLDGAVAYTDSILRVTSEEPAWAWARSGEAHFFAGDDRRATHAFEEALSRDSASTNIYTWKSTALPLAYLYVKQGRSAEAVPLIERSYEHADYLIGRGQEPWNAYYQYAALDLMQADGAGALRWLRAAYLAGMPGRVFMEFDPLLSELRGDPEFETLVQKLGWREREIRERIGG